MKISTKGRYALKMLLDLAMHQDNEFVPLFNKNGFLLTNRGFQGGYKLARTPDKYTVGEILRLAEGSLSPVECTGDKSFCSEYNDCLTLYVWQGLDKVINEYLDSISLQDIIDKHQENFVNNYVI